eukprot:Opistho-2@46663
MSVVGFDFGNDTCYIGVARQGGIEVVTNEYNYRTTPSLVSFGAKHRYIGESANTQTVTNFKNTISNFKLLIGRKFKDADIQAELANVLYKTSELPDGSIGIHVQYLGEEKVLSPTQVTAMLFGQLKTTAERELKTKVVDCVISAPTFFNDAQRRALSDAAQIAGLNSLRIMNDTTAVALNYGIYKQDLPAETEKPRIVVFVDFGQCSFKVAAVSFVKGKLTILSTASDPTLGGRNFDEVLLDHFCTEFKGKYKIDVKSRPKALMRLRAECEKLKKLMGANSTDIPLNIECLMDDIDVKSKMNRTEFETLTQHLFARMEIPLTKVLTDAKLKTDDIFSVEIVGGSSRIPLFKSIISRIYGKEASTTLNADEAVARGCALQCAIISPVFRVREFNVTDITPYAIELFWKSGTGEDSRAEVFSENSQIPSTKMLTFYRGEAFDIHAVYKNAAVVPGGDVNIGTFRISNIRPDRNGQASKVKAKVKVNASGVFAVEAAHMVEDVADITAGAPVPMETDQKEGADVPMPDADAKDGQQPPPLPGQKEAPAAAGDSKKKSVKKTELPIEAQGIATLSKTELNKATEVEVAMALQDKIEKERADAKNAVEEYVYEMRDRLGDRYNEFVTEDVRSQFNTKLDQAESWLYEDGEDETKRAYLEKLGELKKLGDPIVRRFHEAQERPAAEESFRQSVVLLRKAIDQYKNGDEKYAHLDAADVKKVEDTVNSKETWLNDLMFKQNKLAKHDDIVVTAAQITMEKEGMDKVSLPILNKPKPKVEPPKEEPKPAPAPADAPAEAEKPAAAPEADASSANANSANMDLD